MAGLAQGGADTIRLKKQYDKERVEMITSGEQVLSFEEWLKKNGIQPPSNLPPASHNKAKGKP